MTAYTKQIRTINTTKNRPQQRANRTAQRTAQERRNGKRVIEEGVKS